MGDPLFGSCCCWWLRLWMSEISPCLAEKLPFFSELNWLFVPCKEAAGCCCNHASRWPSQTCLVKFGFGSEMCLCVSMCVCVCYSVSAVGWVAYSKYWFNTPARLEARPVLKPSASHWTNSLTKEMDQCVCSGVTLRWLYFGPSLEWCWICMHRTTNTALQTDIELFAIMTSCVPLL